MTRCLVLITLDRIITSSTLVILVNIKQIGRIMLKDTATAHIVTDQLTAYTEHCTTPLLLISKTAETEDLQLIIRLT